MRASPAGRAAITFGEFLACGEEVCGYFITRPHLATPSIFDPVKVAAYISLKLRHCQLFYNESNMGYSIMLSVIWKAGTEAPKRKPCLPMVSKNFPKPEITYHHRTRGD
jgi:hypothetical protein